jgi:hypothetical protein
MLYLYDGKIYIKPLDNRLVEVTVSKKGNEYNVIPSKKWIYLDSQIKEKISEITVEEAYKNKNSKDFDLD